MAEKHCSEAQQKFEERWEKFKIDHKREYEPEEEERRKQIFRETVEMVDAHNEKYEKGLTTYLMGINHFADLDANEKARYTGFRVPPNK